MQKALLLAEKPSVQREVAKAYANHSSEFPFQLDCLALRGHLVRLKEPDEIDDNLKRWSFDTLPFNPDNYKGFETVPIEDADSKRRFNAVKQAVNSGDYDFIIHAGDADQEGELLVRLVLNKINNKLPVKRFWFNASTESEYVKGLKNLRDDSEPMFENLYHAALVRMQADYLLGMNGSRAASIKYNLTGASVGRAISAILNMIVTREEEIQNFKPRTEYGVSVTYGPTPFDGKLYETVTDTDEKGNAVSKEELVYFPDKEDADNIIKQLPDTATVTKIIKKKRTIKSPKLYNLGDLQVDAAKKYGYPSDMTLSIVQSLYDNKYMTYPRSDCNYISPEVNLKTLLGVARIIPGGNVVDTINDADITRVHADKTYINHEECAKHGHTAILITDVAPDFSSLSQEQQNIYTLVAMRFISAFLPPMIQSDSIIYTESGKYKFRSSGKVVIEPGFTKFLGMNFKDTALPDIAEGSVINISSKQISEKTSTCPKRFTESTIVIALNKPAPFLKDKKFKELKDKLHIGTSATQAGLIKKLKDKQYVEVKNKTYYPTETGMALARALRVTDIVDVDTTALWEVNLDKIKHGELSYLDFKKDILKATDKLVDDIKSSTAASIGSSSSSFSIEAVGTCPHCGGKIKESKSGFFCENYPDDKGSCKFKMFKDNKIFKLTRADAEKLCKGEHIKKNIKYNDKEWLQELYYDIEQHKVSFFKQDAVKISAKCPVCGRELVNSPYSLDCSCGFKLSRKIAEYTLNEKDIQDLLKNGRTKQITKFYSKKKKKYFSACLVVNGKDIKFEY